MKPVIIVLDDDAQFRNRMKEAFPPDEYTVFEAATLAEGVAFLKNPRSWPDLVVLDAMFPKDGGSRPTYQAPDYIEALALRPKGGLAPYVILVSLAEETTKYEAQISGWLENRSVAFFLAKATANVGWHVFRLSLRLLAERLLRTRRWNKDELIDSRKDPKAFLAKHHIIGSGPACMELAHEIHFLAEQCPNLDVLICGRPGTGKELVAHALHKERCERAGQAVPLVAASCREFTSDLAASTLFGHVKGAFTGADQQKDGLFTKAKGGVLMLDEVQSLALEDQQILLRALNPGVYSPLGSNQELKKECRVVAATSADLKLGKTRPLLPELLDRFYILYMPSLSERLEDCDSLIASFVDEFNENESWKVSIDESVLRAMRSYNWPGNIRELKSTIEVLMGWAAFYKRDRVDLPLFEAKYPHILAARPAAKTLISPEDLRLSDLGQQAVRDLGKKPESYLRVLSALVDQRHGLAVKDLLSLGISRTHLNENILPDLKNRNIVVQDKNARGTGTNYKITPALLR